jgi:hypothetical protein
MLPDLNYYSDEENYTAEQPSGSNFLTVIFSNHNQTNFYQTYDQINSYQTYDQTNSYQTYNHIHCFHKYWRRLLGLLQVQNLKYRRVILQIIM